MAPEPTDMVEMVEKLIPEKQKLRLAIERKLTITLEKPHSKLPLAYCDSKQVVNVVSNLLDNAVFYTNQGGVTVSFENSGDGFIKVIVKDTGAGIAESDKGKLFQKFVRGSGATQLHPDGSGLGLYIAKKIVEGNNGTINVESEGAGKGSSFSFTLPMYDGKQSDDTTIRPVKQDGRIVIFDQKL